MSQHKIRSFWGLLLAAPNRASPNASRALQQGARVGVNTSTPFLFDTSQLGHGFEGYISPGAPETKKKQSEKWLMSICCLMATGFILLRTKSPPAETFLVS